MECQKCQRKPDTQVTFIQQQTDQKILCEFCIYDEQPSHLLTQLEKMYKHPDQSEKGRFLNLLAYYQKLVDRIPSGPYRDFYKQDLAKYILPPLVEKSNPATNSTHRSAIYTCEPCQYQTDKTSSYKRHLETVRHKKLAHNIIVKKTKVKPLIVCTNCQRTFKRNENLKKHLDRQICTQTQSNKQLPDQTYKQILNNQHNVLLFERYPPERLEGTIKDWLNTFEEFGQKFTSNRYLGLSKIEQKQVTAFVVDLLYSASPEAFEEIIKYLEKLIQQDQKHPVKDRMIQMINRLNTEFTERPPDDVHWTKIAKQLTKFC